MPLLRHDMLPPAGELGVWEITEQEAWFRDQLLLYPAELRQLSDIKGRRRLEWLAARHLVHLMSGRQVRGAFEKDEFGKPHLVGSPWHISISHSHELVAAMASPQPCGIDIQFMVPKITRLAGKFLRPEELASLNAAQELAQLHLYWGAKEALYKAYGRRQLDFKAHIAIAPVDNLAQKGQTTGTIQKEDFVAQYRLTYEIGTSYVLVWAEEITG